MSRLAILLTLLVAPVSGCTSRTTINKWVTAQGGTVCDQRLERARTLAAALGHSCDDVNLEIAVLDRDDLSAFSWPSGQILLSRGLIDALDDSALSAAIAHEIAHVLNHKHLSEVTGLRGGEARLAEEVRADRVGMHLLQAAGIPADAMARMLECVLRDGDLSQQVQADLQRRIRLLHRSPQVD